MGAIWTLAVISAVVGCISVAMMFGDVGATLTSIVHHYSHFNWVFSGSSSEERAVIHPFGLDEFELSA